MVEGEGGRGHFFSLGDQHTLSIEFDDGFEDLEILGNGIATNLLQQMAYEEFEQAAHLNVSGFKEM